MMAGASPSSMTIRELKGMLSGGSISPEEIMEDLISRVELYNSSLRAYIAMDPQRLRRHAKEQGPSGGGRLRGIPITLKDNICVAAEETACASRILEGFHPPYDATVVERLKREGAIIIPRANMDEFAFGSSTENSAFGAARNPWSKELDRVPGGSSGGPAVAVAADLAIAALGSDTGGSIRQPASLCGVVGLKPTYGRVSRYGLIAFASSLDQIGPITKDVTDAAILLSVIAGYDPRDSTSANIDVPDYAARLGEPVSGLRLGIPKLKTDGHLDPAVRRFTDEAIKALGRLGVEPVSIDLAHIEKSVATYYVIATAEASSNLARYDGVQYGARASTQGSQNSVIEMNLQTRTEHFGAEAKRRMLLGTYVLSHGYYDAYYLKGMKVRTLIKQDFDEAFKKCDVVALPTTPSPAFRLGEKIDDPLQMYLSDIFTISSNLAGTPAISVPCGFSDEGLPIGLQLVAAPFREDIILRVAYAYEQATEWHCKKAELNR